MIGDLLNHLWQSTLVAFVAGLLAAALRNNSGNVRYWLWFAASFKFFLPFSILINLGSHLNWAPIGNEINPPMAPVFSPIIVQPASVVFPAAAAAIHGSVDRLHLILFGLWICGAGAIALIRLQSWWRIRKVVRGSTPLTISGMAILAPPANVQFRSSSSLLEPCVIGVWHPVLLMPADAEEHLTRPQLDAVLAHELCHARRRDNLTAAIHMIIEVLFWFYPLVWWIGARLVEERERACDEHVLQLFEQPRAYAEGILNVCKLYAQSSLACVSGVTQSTNIKRRIEDIMNHRVGHKLNAMRKVSLAVVALLSVVTPVGVGIMSGPLQGQTSDLVCTESDPVIRQELQDADDKILHVDGAAREQTAEMMAQELVDRYPEDFIVHIRYQQWIHPTIQPSALIERYRSLAAEHPSNPMFAILYAQSLRGTNAPRAIEVLKNVAASPYDPWMHLTLAESYSSNQVSDFAEARRHLDQWFGACPGSTNWNALGNLMFYGSPATMAKQAAALRAKLEAETDPHLLLSWQFVWMLEVKSRPEAEGAALRQQIALDVARLEAVPTPKDNRWPELLATGHKLAADPKAQ